MEFAHNSPEYSVSEIAGAVKRTVEERFGYVRVRGEISKAGVNAASGHCYLTLKDDKAVLEAVCWKGTMSKLQHKPEAGMEVIATGKLTTYPGRSTYQLVIEALEPAGAGALMAMLEQRKKMLAAEGLFDAARKKPIPYLPEVIGIITSPTGAVIRDILHRLSDRFPRHVLLWPVAVQGQGAAEQVAAAIAGFNTMAKRPDVLIVARGGGSIEDLWAFNEEVVVRAVAASQIPIISGVGHEPDVTLIDYVADKRAPTPTGAAEFAVPVREELLAAVENYAARQNAAVRRQISQCSERVQSLARALPRPQQILAQMAQGLDEIGERLRAALPRWLQVLEQRLSGLSAHLSPRYVAMGIEKQGQHLAQLMQRADHAMLRSIEKRETLLQRAGAMLSALNVESVLKRGFAIVKAGGHVVPSLAAVPANGDLCLQFHDGELHVQAGAKPKKTKTGETAKQAGLFDEA